jgi:hypothetical protein
MRTAIVLALATNTIISVGAATNVQHDASTISYEAFIALAAKERPDTFARLTPDNKASLIRTHATRWLEKHRSSLTISQAALVQEAIDFISPDLYREVPASASLREKEQKIAHRLACSLGSQRAMAAFTFREAAEAKDRSPAQLISGWIDDWAQWLMECVGQ